ncbi:hypothetical protein Vadar_026861 [Vaccinium darrowii]|uniref:Uncharacterized protein n=1 Tax=Vaccinium darrowii TaxID=229202 RepID=A0ACB7ZEK4_9ERIC|nr:hypothetical protein Vadar_026861 [Vaccinium darrowii]
MAETTTSTAAKRYAIVTGANKGIGFEICRQLASNGIMVVLTAGDEKRGIEAIEKVKGKVLITDLVVFHQLDVANPSSIASFADFIKSQFGRRDILFLELFELIMGQLELLQVNNAGIMEAMVDWDAIVCKTYHKDLTEFSHKQLKSNEVMTQTYELTKECLETNYYGAKRMIEAFIPLLQLSNSPRIVNVSSIRGKLKFRAIFSINSEWPKGELNHAEGLTEERFEEVLKVFLKDFKDGSVETKGWPPLVCLYNINSNNGKLGAEEGVASVVTLALVPKDGPSGLFFDQKEVASC